MSDPTPDAMPPASSPSEALSGLLRGELRTACTIRCTPDELFQALTDRDALGLWLGAPGNVEPGEDGAARYEGGESPFFGRVARWEPPRALRLVADADAGADAAAGAGADADAAAPPAADRAPGRALEWTIAPQGDGTCRLTLRLPVPPPIGHPPRVPLAAVELEALWELRLEALRAFLEEGIDLYAHTGGERHLLDGENEDGRDLAASPRDAIEGWLAVSEADGDRRLSVHPGRQAVTLRILPGTDVPVVLTARAHPSGARCRLEVTARGFGSYADWWDEVQELIRVPALALQAADETELLRVRLGALAASLEPESRRWEGRIEAPFAALRQGLSDETALRAWWPGKHVLGADRVSLRGLEDAPAALVGGVVAPAWPGVDARVVERRDEADRAGFVWDVEAEPAPYRVAVRLEIAAAERSTAAQLDLTGLGHDAARADQLAAWWRARLEALGRAAALDVREQIEVEASPEEVAATLTSWEGLARWLEPSAMPASRGVVFRRHGSGGPSETLEIAPDDAPDDASGDEVTGDGPADPDARAPDAPGAPDAPNAPGAPNADDASAPRFLLRWPWEGPPTGAPTLVRVALHPLVSSEPVRTRVFVETRAAAPDDPAERITRWAEIRRRWAWRLLSLRFAAETSAGLAEDAPLGYALGDGALRLAVRVEASAASVFDRLLDEERPLIAAVCGAEQAACDQFAGGGWEVQGARGRLLRVELDEAIEHTVPPLHHGDLGPTVCAWRITPFGRSGVCRVELLERGFGDGPREMARRRTHLRRWRFALEELRAELEAGVSLRQQGIEPALGEGAVRARLDIPAPADQVWGALRGLGWLADDVQLPDAVGAPLLLGGLASPLPETMGGLLLPGREGVALSWLHPSWIDGSTQAVRLFVEPRGEEEARVYVAHEGFCPEREAHRAAVAALGGAGGWAALLGRLRSSVRCSVLKKTRNTNSNRKQETGNGAK